MANLSRAERETIVTRAADQSEWSVWTEDPRVQRILRRRFGPGKKVGEHALRWTLPPSGVQFRKPVKLSAEQRAKALAALAKAREDA